MAKLADDVVDAVFSSEPESVVRKFDLSSERQNQLIFFFKPEVFMFTKKTMPLAIIKLALRAFEGYAAQVSGAIVLSGNALAGKKVMDNHYGYINRMSKSAAKELSVEDRAEIFRRLGVDPSVKILGGHEFLEKYNFHDAYTLERIWESKKHEKLHSGLYYQLQVVDGEKIILLNGFHPSQIAHFTKPDRRIAVLLLDSDAPWRVLRRRMLGDTFPEAAVPGSIRRVLHDRAHDFGFHDVVVSNNCVHLSAGPFEALFEISNFLSQTTAVAFNIKATRVARYMFSCDLGLNHIDYVLTNPRTILNEEETSLFEATEELDTMSSVRLYQLVFAQEIRGQFL
jgi:hypothetical protein